MSLDATCLHLNKHAIPQMQTSSRESSSTSIQNRKSRRKIAANSKTHMESYQRCVVFLFPKHLAHKPLCQQANPFFETSRGAVLYELWSAYSTNDQESKAKVGTNWAGLGTNVLVWLCIAGPEWAVIMINVWSHCHTLTLFKAVIMELVSFCVPFTLVVKRGDERIEALMICGVAACF